MQIFKDYKQFLVPILVAIPAVLVLLVVFHVASQQMKDGAEATLANIGDRIVEKTENFLESPEYTVDFNTEWVAANLDNKDFINHFYLTANKEKKHFSSFGLIYYGDEGGNHWLYKQDPDGISRLRIIERLDDSSRSKEALDRAANLKKDTLEQRGEIERLIASFVKTTWLAPDKDGVLHFDSQDPIKVYDPRQRPWYKGAVKNMGRFWTDVYTWEENFQGKISHQAGITVSAPVIHDGQLMGVAAIDLVLQSISKFLGSLTISPHGRAFIVDSRGFVVGMPDFREMLQASADGKDIRPIHIDHVKDHAMVAAHAALRHLVQAGEGKPLQRFDSKIVHFMDDNLSYISFFRPISHAYSLDWYVGVLMPEEDVMGPLKQKFSWIFGAILVVVLLFLAMIPFYMKAERERRFITGAFSKYISPNRVTFLLENPECLTLGGEYRNCSFVMTDLVGFTSLMEQQGDDGDPATIIKTLNDYLEGMVKIVFKHEGTLDRIVGDAIAVLFSAPLTQGDHARRAVDCALEMDQFAWDFSLARKKEGMPFGHTRIGVNSGRVLLGNFGGNDVFDYRALGDPINTAARLESVNNHLGTRICVSGETVAMLSDFHGRPVGRLVLKGKGHGITAFEPLAREEWDSDRVQAYQKAYCLLENDDPGTLEAFAKALEQWPQDPLLRFHYKRLQNGERGATVTFDQK
ncbi:MAG: Adenylate/guanylate cyclase protein [Magnetococcales bacterium]|nr:Adenylate/guanylate cyclase protein [Magnetococcales bacterium]